MGETINCSVIEIMSLMIVTVVIIEEFSLCQYGERYWQGCICKNAYKFCCFYALIIHNACLWLAAILIYAIREMLISTIFLQEIISCMLLLTVIGK